MKLFSKDFGKTLLKILELSGVSCYEIGKRADIDQAYLSKLKNSEKNNPSPEIIMRICLAIALGAKNNKTIEIRHFEDLFNAVGRTLFTRKRS